MSAIGDEAREAMTWRVYSERYGKPLDEIYLSRALAGIRHYFLLLQEQKRRV